MIPFDINATTLEIKHLDVELHRLKKQVKELTDKKKSLCDKIQGYFNENSHSGVIIHDMKIETVMKSKTKPLTKKEKEEQIKQLLGHYVESPHLVAEQLQKATQGKKIDQQKIVISKKD